MDVNEGGHLIVGVDVGMTYTGVAYSWNNNPVRTIQQWKGLRTSDRYGKVPTRLSYKDGDWNGGRQLEKWGFECDQLRPHVAWFKPYLDPRVLDEFQRHRPADAHTSQDIRRFYVDFLTQLYSWIKETIQRTTNTRRANFRGVKVEFLFSLPSTINSPEIAQKFREYVHQAGFAGGGIRHTAELGLTEPEAAAVDAVTNSDECFEPGDILIVVDAGGATTDVCILQLEGDISQPIFRGLLPVHGTNVGSTNIDEAFRELAKRKLHGCGLRLDPNDCSKKMALGKDFDCEKCCFGEDGGRTNPVWIGVPGLPEDYTNNSQGISTGKMIFTHNEIKELFDPQISAIEKAIRAQLDEFGRLRPPLEQIDHLVLCGGLGISPYLRSELQGSLILNIHPRAQHITVTVSHDPQLAVMKGLVIDRLRRAQTGQPVLASRRSRLSYGILCKVPFDPNVHHIDDMVIDEVDQKEYANGKIKWIIKKGALITPDESILLRNWKQRYLPNAPSRIVEDPIVVSDLDEHLLPKTIRENGAELVCTVESDFSNVPDSELKKAHKNCPWYKRHGELYYILEHHIKILIGAAADLQVQSVFNERNYERETRPVRVSND